MENKSGTLFIIAAPSGAGKTTLVNKICERMSNLQVSISYTTRSRRPGEIDGKDYFFVDDARFQEMVAAGLFLEYATVFDYQYGTSRQWVENKLAKGIDIILEIDWQGARDVRTLIPGTVSIFILPPSFTALEQRLTGRGDDDAKVIRRRMQGALNELSHFKDFDYLIINDDIEHALAEMESIINSIRHNKIPQVPDNRAFAEQIMAEGTEVQ